MLETRRFHLNAMAVFLLTALSIVLFLSRAPLISPISALLALATIWIGLVPALHYFNQAPPRAMPFMPLTGLFYAVFFGLPVFLIPLAWPEGTSLIFWPRPRGEVYNLSPLEITEDPVEAMALIAAGVASLTLVFYLLRFRFLRLVPPIRVLAGERARPVAYLAWLLVAAHFTYLLIPGLKNIPSLGQFLVPAFYAGWGILFVMWLNGKITNRHFALVVLTLAAEAVLRIQNILLTEVALLVVFAGMALMRFRPRTAIVSAFVLALAFLTIYPFWGLARGAGGNPVETLQMMIPTIDKYLRGENVYRTRGFQVYTDIKATAAFPIIRRISLTWPFAYVVSQSPDPIPYWGGTSYKPLFTSVVPRAVWPGKPEERTGYRFGVRYGFVLPIHTHMSFNLPWLTETYANFGRWGVLLGMGLIGAFLALLDRLCNARRMSDEDMMLGAAIMFPLFYQASNLSVMVGTLPVFALCLLVYFAGGLRVFRFVKRKRLFRGTPAN